MKNDWMISLKFLTLSTLLLGGAYTLAITGVAQLAMPGAANGSLVVRGDRVVGSRLLAQNFQSERYFWPRPSAVDYGTVPSGASNLGPTSERLQRLVLERRTQWTARHGGPAPLDMVTTSGSGLDPHISLASARAQIERVARARKIKTSEIEHLVEVLGEGASFLWGGTDRVNVLRLNLALDASVGGESTP
ncbi:MAG TPA: potassium-transporting ATPase subunit KdpC [Bdellovibrionota bacterium]|jgi:K+-transporting ATPase ATPase C chain|nr:potassium-transporting ATPase subunit KdpC [Bdellovibrionota bacterium]